MVGADIVEKRDSPIGCVVYYCVTLTKRYILSAFDWAEHKFQSRLEFKGFVKHDSRTLRCKVLSH